MARYKNQSEIDRLVAHVAERQIDDLVWVWVPIGAGQLFHRKVVERALAAGRVSMLSCGRDEYGVRGYQLRARES